MLLSVCLFAANAIAQTPPAAQPSPSTKPEAASDEILVSRPGATGLLEVAPEKLPPPLVLSRRVEEVRRACQVIPTVVIVPDEASYLEAIAHWTPTRRFPILIDDNTRATREDIARFVRAFEPTDVVRWHAPSTAATPAEAAMTQALARTQGWAPGEIEPATFLHSHWSQHRPPGIVATRIGDSAWPAALALAAFRNQPIIFVPADKAPGTLANAFAPRELDALAEFLAKACDDLAITSPGVRWRAVGDEIETLTICLNCPVKASIGGKDEVATTDQLGRLGTVAVPGARWGWAGQIFGSQSQAAYRAMCALFLHSKRAWIFDGYESTPQWNAYDGTAAAEVLRKALFDVELIDDPKGSEREWRARAEKPVKADLITVTTMGNSDFFELRPGICRPGDVPCLSLPTAVHFTHSWSAQWPARRDTVAGRWLERGAYAYIGSVQEPYLQGFVPTPGVAMRWATGGTWGLVGRQDGGRFAQPWKIAVFGDPLMLFGDPLARSSDPLPLSGSTSVSENAARGLKEGRYGPAISDYVLLGKDDIVARLALALSREKQASQTPGALASAIEPVFRVGTPQQVVDLVAAMPAGEAKDPILGDVLWHAAHALLKAQPDQRTLDVLRANLRDDLLERDATELARAWSLSSSRADALTMLQELRPRYSNTPQKDALEKAIAAYRAR